MKNNGQSHQRSETGLGLKFKAQNFIKKLELEDNSDRLTCPKQRVHENTLIIIIYALIFSNILKLIILTCVLIERYFILENNKKEITKK